MRLRFELRHAEQETEQVEIVASRQPGQFGGSLRDDSRGLIGPAFPACRFLACRMGGPAPLRTPSPACALGQDPLPMPRIFVGYPF